MIILLAVLAVLVVALIAVYNRLVRLRQGVRASWSGIETELTRRYDLIPNLVETVKGYTKHERETLDAVISARNAAKSQIGSPEELARTEAQLSSRAKEVL